MEQFIEIIKSRVDVFNRLCRAKLIDRVKSHTAFLDSIFDNPTLSQRFWHIEHDTQEVPMCYCGKAHAQYTRKYAYTTCSKLCSKIRGAAASRKSYKDKTGYDSNFSDPKAREGMKATMIKNHGVDNPGKSPKIRKAIAETHKQKYGGWYSQ